MIEYELFSQELADKYLNEKVFAFDIETDTESYHWKSGERGLSYVADITYISIYAPDLPVLLLKAVPHEISYLAESLNLDTGEIEEYPTKRNVWEFPDEQKRFIILLFGSDSGYTAIAHNLVFDARQIFGKFNLPIPDNCTLYDTQAIHLTCAFGNPINDEEENQDDFEDDESDEEDNTSEKSKEGLSLEKLTSHWLDKGTREWWQGFKNNRKWLTRLMFDEKFAVKRNVSMDDIDRYAAIDAVMAYKLYAWQQEQEKAPEHINEEEGLYFNSGEELIQIDLDYTKLCVEMAVEGIKLNANYVRTERDKYIKQWLESLESLGLKREEGKIARTIKWKKEYIFSRISEPTDRTTIELFKLKTAKGAWSFNKVAMEYYLDQYPELLVYRRHVDLETKIKRIDEFLRHAEYDGKIHSAVSRLAVTGRNTSNSPNMQNLALKNRSKPYEGKPGLDVGYFMPDSDDDVFISLDGSNAENWMGASYARDNDFAYACAQENFHTAMARDAYFSHIWNTLNDEDKHAYRDQGKIITFGTSYGMGVQKLARTLKITQEEAQTFLDNKDRKFWKTKKMKDISSNAARYHGFTYLWTGRKVRMRKKDGVYKGYTAVNSQNQGGVGELIVRGMLAVDKLLKHNNYPARIVGQVHDEIVIQIQPSIYKEVIIPIIELLSTVVPDSWNNRTTPKTRWLFDLCNKSNAKKWGYIPGKEYPLPLNEYVNRWGIHLYKENESEAPTFINEFGYGIDALNKELGLEENTDHLSNGLKEGFNWLTLSTEIKSTLAFLETIRYNDRIFSFEDGIELLRAKYHKGLDDEYTKYISQFDKLSKIMELYQQWKNT